jgi:hypothetical protein
MSYAKPIIRSFDSRTVESRLWAMMFEKQSDDGRLCPKNCPMMGNYVRKNCPMIGDYVRKNCPMIGDYVRKNCPLMGDYVRKTERSCQSFL